MNNKSNLRVIAISFGKILAMFATFAIPVILARIFTKSNYGLFTQFNTVYLFCAALFSLGFKSNLYYFYPNHTKEKRKSILLQTFFVLLGLSLVASSFVLIPNLNKFLLGDESLAQFAPYIAFAIILYMCTSIIEPIYVIRGDNRVSLFYPVSAKLLMATFVIVSALVFKSITAAIIATLIGLSILFLFTLFYIKLEINSLPKGKNFSMLILKKQMNYSLPFGASVAIRAVITKIDKILAITFLSTSSYATYSVAFFAIPGVQAIYDALTQVYILEMAKEFKNGDFKKVTTIYHDLVTKSYSYTVPFVVIVYFYADVIIKTLFTENYTDSIILFRIYLFATFFLVLGAGVVIRASGKTKYTLNAYIMSSFISLPITYYLLSNYGVIGAITSALIAVIIPAMFLLRFDIKVLNSSFIHFFPWKNIFTISAISIICFVPFYCLHFIFEKSFINMLLFSIFYVLCVSLIEYRFGLFLIEKENIKKLIGRFFNK